MAEHTSSPIMPGAESPDVEPEQPEAGTEPLEPAPEEIPTAEQPSAEAGTPENQGEAFIGIDPDKDVFAQLSRSAAEQGNPGMVGLEWVEAGGRRFRVSSHERLTVPRTELVKTRKLTVTKPDSIGMGSMGLIGLGKVRRKEVAKTVTEEVDYRTVDVFDADGNLVDVMTFVGSHREWISRGVYGPLKAKTTAYGKPVKPKEYKDVDNFQSYFYVNSGANKNAKGATTKVPREVLGFRWTDESSPETRTMDEDSVRAPSISNRDPGIPNRDPSRLTKKELEEKAAEDVQQLFEALAQQRSELGIDGWEGLTWNSPLPQIFKGRQPDQMQIIRDTIILKKDPVSGQESPQRIFEVRTTSQGKSAKRFIYTLEQLQGLFEGKVVDDWQYHQQRLQRHRAHLRNEDRDLPSLPPPSALNLHWENLRSENHDENVPSDPLERWYWEEERLLEGFIPKAEPAQPTTERVADPYITYEDALALLVEGNLEQTAHTALGRHALHKNIANIGELIKNSELPAYARSKVKKGDLDHAKTLHADAQELRKTLSDIGSERLYEVVTEMEEAYSTVVVDLRRLGIALPEKHPLENMGQNTILKQLMAWRRNGVSQIFDDGSAGRQIREMLIEGVLGDAFIGATLHTTKKRIPTGETDESGKELKKLVSIRQENHEASGRLKYLLFSERIRELLDKEKQNHEQESQLDRNDRVAMGHMIRLSFGRS